MTSDGAGGPGAAMMTAGRIALGVAAAGLGVIGLAAGDFALQWQPVPEDVPGRTVLAYAGAGVLAALGAGLLVKRFERVFALGLAVLFLLWTVLLHGPVAVASPLRVISWLGFFEILAVAMGALTLAAARTPGTSFARGAGIAARYVFGACLPVFGLSHFAYPEATAGMIPAWIPFPLFWAYVTGAGHMAAGLAILTGVLARVGAVLFAGMVSGFVLLLHVPRVIGDPASRLEWTMLVVSTLITSAAWIIAGGMVSMRRD